jgi:GT2 family glycosyltransferase
VGVIYTHERQFMPRLLDTLGRSADGFASRLLLVDNASADGAEQWRPLLPRMDIVRNDRRLHYAANLNRVLAVCDARYALLLNTDMYFDPPTQCVARMIEFMDAHPRCGVAGCRLLHGDGEHAPSARRFQTLSTILARRLGLARVLPGTIDHYLYADRAAEDTFTCDWLSGCFLMVRREAIAEAGQFDERFVKYFEDVDLCLRIARAGWEVWYHGQPYCYHLEQRDSAQLFSPDARRHLRSYLRFLAKWGFSPARHIAKRAA